MSDSLKDRITSDIQKAKTESGTRVNRIGVILREAASQSLAEVKAGSSQVRLIATQTLSTVTDQLNQSANSPEPADNKPSQPFMKTLFQAIQRQVVARLRTQIVTLDTKLTVRYGDRYELLKQRVENSRLWYKNARANAEAAGIDPLQQKQVEIETKVGDVGITVAQKEQQIRQQVKEFVQSAVSKG